MANRNQLKILKQGAEAWNAWRKKHPVLKADFTGANLTDANLTDANLISANLIGANLIRANLTDANLISANLIGAHLIRANLTSANPIEANLTDANLTDANLISANLTDANLFGANLTDANLAKANLTRANLTDADLTSANLSRANLTDADLTGADLTGCNFGDTIIGNSNLNDVKGLNTCIHRGPSTIDHRTLEKSGVLPASFLRGCGLSDIYIQYLPSLLNTPIQFYDCFISYSHQDEEFAQKLHSDLQSSGVRCWYAPEDLKIGEPIRKTIDDQIRINDKLLVIFSEYSIDSDWVEHEVNTALKHEVNSGRQKLFPIRVDNSIMETEFGWAKKIRQAEKPTGRHIGDFVDWKNYDPYMVSFTRLLRDLKVDRSIS